MFAQFSASGNFFWSGTFGSTDATEPSGASEPGTGERYARAVPRYREPLRAAGALCKLGLFRDDIALRMTDATARS
jgi:hypothetical protein